MMTQMNTVVDTVYSLSEIEAHAKKAVRGAGFAWGYAEEAGKAVRLLAAHQLPGAEVLAAYLSERTEANVFSGPVVADDGWKAADLAQALCPVLSGAVLCDHAQAVVAQGSDVFLTELAYPLLVLPYIDLLSRRLNGALQVRWEGVGLVCHQGRLIQAVVDDTSLLAARASRFSCKALAEAEAGEETSEEAGNRGQALSGAVWRQLNDFAHQTYVPATEASRLGAGPA